MLTNLYVIHDIEAAIALTPLMTSRNDVAVIREFSDLVNNKDTIFGKFPQGFALVQIGTVDLETFDLKETEPRVVHTGLDLIKKDQ